MIALLNSPVFPMQSDGLNDYLTLHVESCMVSRAQVYAHHQGKFMPGTRTVWASCKYVH